MKKILLTILSVSWLFGASGGDIFRSSFVVDQLEYQKNDEKSLSWDSYYFAGYDLDKIYIYSEGEKPKSGKASIETQLVYSKALTSFWDIQMGIEQDKTPDHSKTWAIFGFQGLAQYFLETKTSFLFASDGNIAIKTNTEYDLLLSQKLILSPSIKLSAFSKNDESMEIGKGVSNMTIGARLRYEFKREFAPYLGFEWNKNYGKTNIYSPLDEKYLNFGIRFWL